ncbi:hypothetical protein N0V93_000685 [Gnomoniopsis smithogilvyi]|uniref:Aromatic amino acid beta-eliminating lyase/threonine aldolase domain-containing protein n=1 Tax=Gnomoniopsis smithogilvyi TaxID=1191159 RepID=A0A9W8Z246_9PEZI|nr:hypothetical protein N0V93_000685 [Gnomoniopsis smithogilvyi]
MKEKSSVMYWGRPERTGSAFDFRSDVVTAPSVSILRAMKHATLNDDVYGEDHTTASFENDLATVCGKEAAAFVVTGTMANQLALRALLDLAPPYAVLADADSHIIHWEAGGMASLSGAMVQAVRPMNGKYLTLEDIKKHAVLTDDVHKCPTRVISIENTSSGLIVPLNELQRIKNWAERNGVRVHIDGARLWEAVAAAAGTLCDFASCADLVTLDFSKNLGAPMGAMVLGCSDDIKRLKRIRKGIGGGMRQAGVLAAGARQAVTENFGMQAVTCSDVLKRTHDLARTVARMWSVRGGRLLKGVETNMVWVDLKSPGIDVEKWNAKGRKYGILIDGKRIVVHHQISDTAITRLGKVMGEALADTEPRKPASQVLAKI